MHDRGRGQLAVAEGHQGKGIGKQLVGKPAEFAGDPDLQDDERVFGWIQAETETGEYTARNDEFDRVFEEEYGGEIAARSTYIFNPGAAQETGGAMRAWGLVVVVTALVAAATSPASATTPSGGR